MLCCLAARAPATDREVPGSKLASTGTGRSSRVQCVSFKPCIHSLPGSAYRTFAPTRLWDALLAAGLLHYNVLADKYGSNLQPWFLFGSEPPVTEEERSLLLERFYEKDASGRYVNLGWPSWAKGLLTAGRQRQIERCDKETFDWSVRSPRLWADVKAAGTDLITLVECDHYDDFWRDRLQAAGYSSVWRKRPRGNSPDGCTIAWRNSTFELIAHDGVDFADSIDGQARGELDRTLLLALLQFKRNPQQRVVIATTHLARNPENRQQHLPRGYQYGLLFRELLVFAAAHGALDAPVVIAGDLNAQCVDELSELSKGVAAVCGGMEKAHPVLWSIRDAPTSATTRTEVRQCRIDYVLYQTSKLVLRSVGKLPALDRAMPNVDQPSDHAPVRESPPSISFHQLSSALHQLLALISSRSFNLSRLNLPAHRTDKLLIAL